MIKLPVFKKKKCFYIYKGFVLVSAFQILFPSLDENKNCKITLMLMPPDPPAIFRTNNTCWSIPCLTRIALNGS